MWNCGYRYSRDVVDRNGCGTGGCRCFRVGVDSGYMCSRVGEDRSGCGTVGPGVPGWEWIEVGVGLWV